MKKIAIITGGTNGIGKELTIRLIKENYYVYVFSRSKTQLELLNIFNEYLNDIYFYSIDLDNFNEITKMIQFINNLRKVDLFIWNAGVAYNQIKDIKGNKIINVNFLSHAVITLNVIKKFTHQIYINFINFI